MSGIARASRTKRVALATGAVLLALIGTELAAPAKSRSWLGPLAPVAAQVQWVRAEGAIQAGLSGEALRLMESAIELDPTSTTGWITLSDHLGLYLASAESGAAMETRASWLQTALDLTRRGEAWAQHPERLALHRGLLLVSHADLLESLDWGGSSGDRARMALFQDAAAAFDEAAALGHPDGEEIAQYARLMIEGLRDKGV
jgi:hypothetical protein